MANAHIFLLILIILSGTFAENHKREEVIYYSVGDRARGMQNWNYGRSNGDWCDGLAGSSDC